MQSNKTKMLYVMIVAALTFLVGSALGQPPGASPEVVIRNLGASLQGDDTQGAAKLMTSDVGTAFQAMMEASDRFQKARTAFYQALTAKFGTRFDKPAQSSRDRFKSIDNIAIKEVTQKGNDSQQVKAEVSFKDRSRTEKVTINMSMQDGQWKIGLADQQQMQSSQNQTQRINALAGEIEQMTRDVSGGKYASSLQAQFALQELARKYSAKGGAK